MDKCGLAWTDNVNSDSNDLRWLVKYGYECSDAPEFVFIELNVQVLSFWDL